MVSRAVIRVSCALALAGCAVSAQEGASPLRTDAAGMRIVVSLPQRTLWVLNGPDTLRRVPVAVPSNTTLQYAGRRWRFALPPGRRFVVRKDSAPLWIPPDWHYYEVARDRKLSIRRMQARTPVPISGDRALELRHDQVGVRHRDGTFEILPAQYEIIYDGALFIPPIGSRNRRIAGVLGRYRLDVGGGHSMHGTSRPESVGLAVTHGCLRLGDADIEWLYRFVPIGTPVDILGR